MSTAQWDIIEAMAVRHSLDLNRYHEDFLAKTLERRRLATGAYTRHLSHTPEEGKALASALYNTFSEFFRNPMTFAILEQIVLPQLRQWVDFSEHDLLDERLASPPTSIFGGFDLILCCNLLFYY